MIILGIDPGTARTGWGVIEIENLKFKTKNFRLLGYGCVLTDKDDGVGKRLVILRRELKNVIKTHNPDILAIERLFFGMNAKTVMSVGQATGVILLSAGELKVPVVEYTGLQVKLGIAGHGRADKKVVQKKIRQMLGRTKRVLSFSAKDRAWDDAADALAIAIYHATRKT